MRFTWKFKNILNPPKYDASEYYVEESLTMRFYLQRGNTSDQWERCTLINAPSPLGSEVESMRAKVLASRYWQSEEHYIRFLCKDPIDVESELE